MINVKKINFKIDFELGTTKYTVNIKQVILMETSGRGLL